MELVWSRINDSGEFNSAIVLILTGYLMKINIIGCGWGWEIAPGFSKDHPTNNEASWGFNDFSLKRPVDVIIDMHNLPKMLAGEIDTGRLTIATIQAGLDKAKESNTLIYSLEAWEGLGCVKYPLEEILERFKVDYFTSGFSYAIALALYKGVTDLNLYGITLSGFQEYQEQKPCVEFWLGMAKGMGVNVGLYGESEALRARDRKLYGYNTLQG